LSAIHIEFRDLVSATDTAQTFVAALSPDAMTSVGIAGMMLTNFLASGLVCGLFNEEFVDRLMAAIRESIDDSVKSINDGLAAEAATQTIQ
jgi:hypothetical protein